MSGEMQYPPRLLKIAGVSQGILRSFYKVKAVSSNVNRKELTLSRLVSMLCVVQGFRGSGVRS